MKPGAFARVVFFSKLPLRTEYTLRVQSSRKLLQGIGTSLISSFFYESQLTNRRPHKNQDSFMEYYKQNVSGEKINISSFAPHLFLHHENPREERTFVSSQLSGGNLSYFILDHFQQQKKWNCNFS